MERSEMWAEVENRCALCPKHRRIRENQHHELLLCGEYNVVGSFAERALLGSYLSIQPQEFQQ